MSAPAVRLSGVRKAFDDVVALDDVSLELEAGTMLALLGPSGCGKTTALRLISGFEQPDAGTVEVSGRLVASPASMVPPERRRIGLVFQDLALFPHLSVRDNVAYGIRRDPGHRVRVEELLEMVGMSSDAERMPHELSGGMQQRVALARALAPRPDVLLLDEPFSSLDQAMRTQLRAEVRQILRHARQSAIFVTHDQGEALTVADRVAVMTRGRVLQVASPEIIYAEPATPYVATFVGVSNLVSAEVDHDMATTRFGQVRLIDSGTRRPQGHALCLLRPEHFSIDEAPDGPDEAADGTASAGGWEVIDRRFSGSEILLELRSDDGERLWVEAGSRVRHLGMGDRVGVHLRDVETVAFGRRNTPATETAHPAGTSITSSSSSSSSSSGSSGSSATTPGPALPAASKAAR